MDSRIVLDGISSGTETSVALNQMEFFKILAATLPVFLIVGVGFLTRRLRVVTDEAEKSIMRLVINVLYPCFILSNVPGNESLAEPTLVVLAIAIGFSLTVIALALAYATAQVLKISADDGQNTFCVATAIQNYGFIPIPLIVALFPGSSRETLGVLFVHNLGLEIAMWTICIVMLSGTIAGSWKRLINGPTIAIAFGLILNFTGLYVWIPEIVSKAMADLGNCSIPISLVLVGATLAGVVEKQKAKIDWRIIGGSTFVRFLVMPALILMVASCCNFSKELQRVLIIESAMPAAIFPIVLAKHYGGKPSVAVQIVIATSILSLLLTPLLILAGVKILGVTE